MGKQGGLTKDRVDAWDAISIDVDVRKSKQWVVSTGGYIKENSGAASKIKSLLNSDYLRDNPQRRMRFLNALQHNQLSESPTKFRFNPGGIQLVRFADPDEIVAAIKKFENHRKSNTNIGSKNLCFTDGAGQNNIMWVSGLPKDDLNYPKTPDGKPVELFNALDGREKHTEYKALTSYAHEQGLTKDDIESGTSKSNFATISIYSENPTCYSCNGVIEQFQRFFPNIKFIIGHGITDPN